MINTIKKVMANKEVPLIYNEYRLRALESALEENGSSVETALKQNLNIMRKIALNLARIYKDRYVPRSSISGVLKRNLFNIANLACFINNFVVLVDVTILLRN